MVETTSQTSWRDLCLSTPENCERFDRFFTDFENRFRQKPLIPTAKADLAMLMNDLVVDSRTCDPNKLQELFALVRNSLAVFAGVPDNQFGEPDLMDPKAREITHLLQNFLQESRHKQPTTPPDARIKPAVYEGTDSQKKLDGPLQTWSQRTDLTSASAAGRRKFRKITAALGNRRK